MPRTTKGLSTDPGILSAALEGLELQKQRIEDQIRQVRALLGKPAGRMAQATGQGSKPSARRELSEAARRRISLAQKKRWAEYRKKAKTDAAAAK